MSRRQRARERQRRLNSPQHKMKQAKKAYYASDAAKKKWEEKKAQKAKNN